MMSAEVAMDVEIVEQPARRLGTVRHIGPYHGIGQAFGRLGAALAAAQAASHAGEMLALFHDNPREVAAEALRSDAAVALPDDVPIPPGLVELRQPATTCAAVEHVGAYEQLGEVWGRLLGEWLPASGRRPAPAASYEIYLNDPRVTPKAELRTKLCLPLV